MLMVRFTTLNVIALPPGGGICQHLWRQIRHTSKKSYVANSKSWTTLHEKIAHKTTRRKEPQDFHHLQTTKVCLCLLLSGSTHLLKSNLTALIILVELLPTKACLYFWQPSHHSSAWTSWQPYSAFSCRPWTLAIPCERTAITFLREQQLAK